MTIHLGDVPSGSTLYIPFASYNSSGASVTLSGLATSDLLLYKNGSTTQRSSTNGFALLDTDGIDFDGVTGLHGFSIDLSDNTDSGFYAAGSFYWVVVSTVTIDSQTVTLIAATFRIRAAEHTAGYNVVTIKDGTGTGEIDTTSGGVLVAAIANNAITASSIASDAITDAKVASDVTIASVTGSVGSVAAGGISASSFAAGAIDNAAIASNAIGSAEIADGAITAAKLASDCITAAKLASDVTTELQSGLATASALSTVDGKIDTIDSNVDAVLADTAEIGAAGAGLSAVPWNAAWDAEVQSEATDALNAYDPPTRAEATSDKNEILAKVQGFVLESGTIGGTGNDATHVHLPGFTYGNDEINNYLLVIYDASEDEYHARYVEDWANASKLATVATLPFTPQDSTDGYFLLPFRQDVTGGSGLDAAGVRAAVGLASANLDTQLGAIDSNVDSILDDTGTSGVAVAAGSKTGYTLSTAGLAAFFTSDSGEAYADAVAGSVVKEIADNAGGASLTVQDIVDGVWDEARSSHTDSGSFGQGVASVQGNVTGSVASVSGNVGGNVAGSVGSVTGNVGGNVTGSVGSLATQAKADVQAEAEEALQTYNLDHLVKSAVDTNFATTVHADSVIGQIADNGAGFDRSTDSLEAIRDRGDAAWATATGFSTHSASDVWSVGTRVLTAATNITSTGGSVPITGGGLVSADVTAISADTTAADNAESYFDGTGYGPVLQRTTIASLSSQTSFTLTAGSADDDAYNGCVIVIQDASTAAQKAVGVIADYTGSSKTVALLSDPGVFTMAASDVVTVLADRALKATVDNRTLDVSAAGEAGIDWANVGSPTTTVNLSGTTVKTATDVESDTADIQSRLPAALVSGRMASDAVAISGSTGAADAVEANVGNLDAAVSSRLASSSISLSGGAVTVGTNSDKTGYSLSSAGIQAVWDALTSALTTAGSVGKLLADNVNATISSRLASASYAAPLDAAGTRSALGLASANLDTQLDAVPTANENADALLDRSAGVETNRTPRQALRLMLAALAGKLSGAATTTVTIRDTNDSKDRIVSTVDSDGNRTSLTYDAS